MKLFSYVFFLSIILSAEIAAKTHIISIIEAVPDTIENFDDSTIELHSYADQDLNPDSWSLTNTVTYHNTPYSLKLFGNTWKIENISPVTLDTGSVWQISALIQDAAEIQGFGITDSINSLFYSFEGTEEVIFDNWVTVYQGAFPNYTWNEYQLPVASDWLAEFGYLPEIKAVIFVNDRDYVSSGTVYFDEILDITNILASEPVVQISYTIGKLYRNSEGLTSVDVDFTSTVTDPDNGEHTYLWNFGDDSVSTEENPSHTFIIEDDHEYTVLLVVTDNTNLKGTASCKILVDSGTTTFPITINFVGDIMLARRIDDYITLNGVEPLFYPTLEILGDAAQVTIANLECTLTNQGTAHPTKPIVFRGNPENVKALNYAGIDYVSLASNHILDYGIEGLLQTQSVLSDSGIIHFGAGINSYQALLPVFYLKSGVNLSIIGSSDRTGQYNNYQPYLNAGFNKPGFGELNEFNISQQISSVRSAADFIVFEMHSGSEYSTTPDKLYNTYETEAEFFSPYLRSPSEGDIEMRRYAIDQGADAVICHHPHIIHGFEVYKKKLIAHSLGNFVFDLDYPETFPSLILNAKIDETGFYEYNVTPVYIDNYVPVRAKGELGLYLLDDLAKRSKDLNTLLKIDRKEVTAGIVLDTALIDPKYNNSENELTLYLKEGEYISHPLLLSKNGSIFSINSIEPATNWQYRLGRELVWFGNFEDEGCTLWYIDNNDEYYDTTQHFGGERSFCQKRIPGQQSINTNLEHRLIIYSDTSIYTLHTNLKTTNSNNTGIKVQFFPDRTSINLLGSSDLGVEVDSTTNWKFYFNDFSSPAGTEYINVRLVSEAPQTGTAYSNFDNTGIIEWNEWQNYIPYEEISTPNDYYWLQIKSENEVLSAIVNYTETEYTDVVITSGRQEVRFPEKFVLYQNYPNPFNLNTTIQYEIPYQTNIMLKIYNILGEEIRTIVNDFQQPGKKAVRWDGMDNSGKIVCSGVYFYRLQTNEYLQTKKLMLIK